MEKLPPSTDHQFEQMAPQQMIEPKAAARLIGFSVRYLEEDRAKPKPLIPFSRYGRAIRYRVADLIAFGEAHKVAA